ncbi:MAG: hypothetical protein IT353_15565 [Gemmatimonadaceae bacterium]|nr:hypothetical protein [Gemmatimonadaceae bacterium]
MSTSDLNQRFHDRTPGPDLPFVLGDTVRVVEGVYTGKEGEVVVLEYAESPLSFLVEFGDGTDESFPARSLTLVQRAA